MEWLPLLFKSHVIMLPLFWYFFGEIWEYVEKNNRYIFRGMTLPGFDNNSSSSTQESSPNKEFNDSSDDFSANKRSTSKEMAQDVVFCVHMALEETFEQGHIIDRKTFTQQTQN